MYKKITLAILLAELTLITAPVWADPIAVSDTDTIQTILTVHMNKKVTVQTKSGQEITGTVKAVNEKLTHISALSGREFFDAVVKIKYIEAVIFRTKFQ